MGRGESGEVGFEDVERAAPDVLLDELAEQARSHALVTGVIAGDKEIDFNVVDWSRSRYEEALKSFTHPTGEPMPSDGGQIVTSAVVYTAAWNLRERGGTVKEAERLIPKLHEMVGGSRIFCERAFWLGWDDRSEDARCTRRWKLISS